MDMAGVKMLLKDFLECFPPPQAGRIVEGIQPDFDAHTAFDLPNGSVLNFHRQVSPNVPISFSHGNTETKLTLPLEFLGKFHLVPFDTETGDTAPDFEYKTVGDLIKVFPVYAKVNRTILGENDQTWDTDATTIHCGDHLKLIRLVHKHGQKLLECRLVGEARICLLPMDCEGHFAVVPDHSEYMLMDLMNMLPRKRRLQIVQNGIKHQIPGLPADFSGDVFLEEPESFVEASPADRPSLIIGLPINLNITVTPEEQCYDKGIALNMFANNNRNLFPLVARMTDWDEETTILENHNVKPGIDLVVHGWTRQSKVLAAVSGKHYAIPLAYQGRFRIMPAKFHGVSELERSHPAYPVRVREEDPQHPLCSGDVVRVRRMDSMRPLKSNDNHVIKLEKIEGSGRYKEIKLPMSCSATFEEVVQGDKGSETYSIKELVPFVMESEVVVELVKSSPDQKIKERDIPANTAVTLCDFVIEPAVYVSVETAETPAFHVPLRTLIHMTFIQQLDKEASPLLTRQNARLSTLDRCIEVVPEDVFAALQPKNIEGSTDSLAGGQQHTTAWVTSEGGNRPTTTEETLNFSTLPNMNRSRALSQDSSRKQSIASDVSFGKSKSLKSKLKNRFRKHSKSQENLCDVSTSEFSMAASNLSTLSYTRADHLARYNSVDLDSRGRETHRSSHQSLMRSASVDGTLDGPSRRSSRSPSPPVSVVSAATTSNLLDEEDGVVKANPLFQSQQSQSTSDLYTARASVHMSEQGDLSSPQNRIHVNTVNTAAEPIPVYKVQHNQPKAATNTQPVSHPGQAPVGATIHAPTLSAGQQMQVNNNYLHQVPVPMLPQGHSGFVMMPQPTLSSGSVPGVPPGYMLVPLITPDMMAKLTNSQRESDDDSVEFSDVAFRQKKQFKVSIPPDGNLYNFSAKKMQEFFRQLRISDEAVRRCAKEKIDGRKFARMSEADLESNGLMQPIVVHFRKLTHRK